MPAHLANVAGKCALYTAASYKEAPHSSTFLLEKRGDIEKAHLLNEVVKMQGKKNSTPTS